MSITFCTLQRRHKPSVWIIRSEFDITGLQCRPGRIVSLLYKRQRPIAIFCFSKHNFKDKVVVFDLSRMQGKVIGLKQILYTKYICLKLRVKWLDEVMFGCRKKRKWSLEECFCVQTKWNLSAGTAKFLTCVANRQNRYRLFPTVSIRQRRH